MTGQDGLRNEIAIAVWAVLQREMPSAANTKRADLAADAVLDKVQTRIDAARVQVAQISYMTQEISKVLGVEAETPSEAITLVRGLKLAADLGYEWKAERDAAREQVAEQIAQAIEAEYVDSPWIRTAIDIARRHAKGDIEGWLEQRDAAVARAEAAEQAVQRVRAPSDEDIEQIARSLYRQRWNGNQDMSEGMLRIYLEWAGQAVAAIRALDGTP